MTWAIPVPPFFLCTGAISRSQYLCALPSRSLPSSLLSSLALPVASLPPSPQVPVAFLGHCPDLTVLVLLPICPFNPPILFTLPPTFPVMTGLVPTEFFTTQLPSAMCGMSLSMRLRVGVSPVMNLREQTGKGTIAVAQE